MQIQARFCLGEVTRCKMYAPNPEGKDKQWVPVEGVRVKLSPVTGEPFGSATPGGSLKWSLPIRKQRMSFSTRLLGKSTTCFSHHGRPDMAQLGDATMKVHITWDSEPTEEAKNFVRIEVLKVLQTTFQEDSWFSELVRTEVHKALEEERIELGKAMYKGSQR